MKTNLRIGDYLVPIKNIEGDNGERYEILNITEEKIELLNLKKGWEILTKTWVDLLNEFCELDLISEKSLQIEEVIKIIQKNLSKGLYSDARLYLEQIKATITPVSKNHLYLVVMEKLDDSGLLKAATFSLPRDLKYLKRDYPLLASNIWFLTNEDKNAV